MFDILPLDFSGMRVLDLFAGSGNVSIEALSRGAAKAILIDDSPRSAATIRDNLLRLDFKDRAQVWIAPVFRSLRKLARSGEIFDLIFVDPPYDKGLVEMSLKILARAELLDADGRLVVEHSARESVKSRYDKLVLHDQRRYGDTLLSFFKADAASPEAP